MEPPLLQVREVAAVLSDPAFASMECRADMSVEDDRLVLSVSVHVGDLERVEFREALESMLRTAQVRAFANLYGIPEARLRQFLAAAAST